MTLSINSIDQLNLFPEKSMIRIFHFSVFLISLILILSNTKISYQEIVKTNEINTEINKSDEENYKKIEEENIKINKQKDESVLNAAIVLVAIAVILTIIFYYFGKLKECPSCKKIYAAKIIGCIPADDSKDSKIESVKKYVVKKKMQVLRT
jgi:hypothetical protein